MEESTKRIIAAAVSADATIDVSRLNDAIAVLSGAVSIPRADGIGIGSVEPILKRDEVARLAKISKCRVDFYARKGDLVRVRFPGSRRSSGITLESVKRFLGAGQYCIDHIQ